MKQTGKRQYQSFEYGAVIMVVATVLVKVIGAAFKVPISWLIGTLGFGYFSTAYDLYLPIYSLAMAGLPIAVSRMIAENVAKKSFNDVKQTLRVSRRTFWVTGIVGFAVMLALAFPFVNITGDAGTLPSIFVIAPAILFCCVMSIYRGYYEGMRNMYPTAVSNIIEALGKLILGYSFAYAVIKIRENVPTDILNSAEALASYEAQTASYAAAGAMLGITVGTILATLYLVIKFRVKGDLITSDEYALSKPAISAKQTFKMLIVIAIPVVLGSLAQNIASLVDVTMVKTQLKNLMVDHSDTIRAMFDTAISDTLPTENIPTFLYGVRGQAFTIYNLAPTITSVIGISALPVLATSWTKKDIPAVKSNIESMIKFTGLIAFPAGLGLAFLAKPIMSLLYSTNEAVIIGGPMLAILGVTAIFACFAMPLTNMLQAVGRQVVPARNIAIAVVIKVVVNFVLVGIPQVNIIGSAVGTFSCYSFIAIANFISLVRYTKTRPNLFKVIVKPFIAALLCAVSAFGVTVILGSSKIITICAVLVAAAVYVVALFALRAIEREDILSFPKGEKMCSLLEKLHILH